MSKIVLLTLNIQRQEHLIGTQRTFGDLIKIRG